MALRIAHHHPTAVFLVFSALVYLFVGVTTAVEHDVFKTCSQSSFCRRCRALKPGTSTFNVINDTQTTTASSVSVDVLNSENGQLFVLSVQALQSNTFRVQIDEKTPLRPRYRIEDALRQDPVVAALTVGAAQATEITLTSGENRVVITKQPLRIDFYQNNVLTVTANGKGLMRFEHYRAKPAEGSVPGNSIEEQDPGSWTESFTTLQTTFVDNKPYGPEAIALDFGFPQAKVLFGIPAHADSLSLKDTTSTTSDPYRLYNLDVAFHEVDSKMSLYGAVPVIYGHGADRTAGVFWHNSAETWVDIYNRTDATNPLTANFMTESGIVDAFVMLGPRPADTFAQYTTLTGVTPLPQLYTLAYHQCRWNYDNETDVMEVAARFQSNGIPLDTMWLDIEYTDQKKYFTWDPVAFAHPLEMIANLSAAGRRLHVIVDIHLKYDETYQPNVDCIAQNLYTKNQTGFDYTGDCWPGKSGYPDVFKPEARSYLAGRYSNLSNFPGTTRDVMIWNDMNEPSVFDGPEKTMDKTNLHWSQDRQWEHRSLHNQFGHMQLRSTYAGLLARGEQKLRPFVLTRSHFAGSQRYAMIWTGDNTADWPYLQVSLKMCLAEAVAGFSFCGADVGGFFGDPTPELFTRWYQAAAWTPFYRSHANLGTPRREPWLFAPEVMGRIRAAVKRRYVYLPLWYTLFYEHERFGLPVMRPLLTEFPTEEETFAMDHQFMLGGVLLVHPVMTAGAQTERVYLPAEQWYDIDDYQVYNGTGAYREMTGVTMDKTYVYQRAGTILAQRRVERLASVYMKEDPYTLVVCVNGQGGAAGTVYADDGQSFEYANGTYLYAKLVFANGTLTSRRADANTQFATSTVVERVVLAGWEGELKSATLETGVVQNNASALTVSREGNTWVLVLGTELRMNEEWTVRFNGAAGLGASMVVMAVGAMMAVYGWIG